MKFKTHFLLAERINKEDIIDLYILMALGTPTDEAHAFVADEIANKIKRNITSEIEGILTRELRHMDDEVRWPWDIHGSHTTEFEHFSEEELKNIMARNPDEREVVQKEADMVFGPGVLEAHEYVYGLIKSEKFLVYEYDHNRDNEWGDSSEITIAELAEESGLPWTIDSVINAFNKLDWRDGYGGENWAKIAMQAKNLIEATPKETFEKLDRFIDYVHNSGPVLNKFYGYKKGWLQFILDLKAQSLNIRELIPYASRDIKKMFTDLSWRAKMMKIGGMGSSESNKVIRPLLLKYIPAVTKDIMKTRYIANSIGRNAFVNLFKEYPVEEIIQHVKLEDKEMMDALKGLATSIGSWYSTALSKTPEKYFEEYFNTFMREVPEPFITHITGLIKSVDGFKKPPPVPENDKDNLWW